MKDQLTHAESVMLLAECQDIMVEQETSIAALKAEIEKLNQTILEQQSKIKHYDEWLSDGVYFTNEEYRKEVATLKSTLEAHGREARIKTLEEAAAHFADTPKGREVRAELRCLADELKR